MLKDAFAKPDFSACTSGTVHNTQHKFFDEDFKNRGFMGYRRYPSEELLRFVSRRYLTELSPAQISNTKILEIGCGIGANLWAMAKEGFNAFGCDFSTSAIDNCYQLLDWYNVSANLSMQDMTALNYPDNTFDCVYDIFASYCLTEADYDKVVHGISRVLKAGGRFFSYTPSKNSTIFTDYSPAEFLDKSTLNGIYRKDSPFYGNFYPFRFMGKKDVTDIFSRHGFKIDYFETETHTYFQGKESVEFLVFEALKI